MEVSLDELRQGHRLAPLLALIVFGVSVILVEIALVTQCWFRGLFIYYLSVRLPTYRPFCSFY